MLEGKKERSGPKRPTSDVDAIITTPSPRKRQPSRRSLIDENDDCGLGPIQRRHLVTSDQLASCMIHHESTTDSTTKPSKKDKKDSSKEFKVKVCTESASENDDAFEIPYISDDEATAPVDNRSFIKSKKSKNKKNKILKRVSETKQLSSNDASITIQSPRPDDGDDHGIKQLKNQPKHQSRHEKGPERDKKVSSNHLGEQQEKQDQEQPQEKPHQDERQKMQRKPSSFQQEHRKPSPPYSIAEISSPRPTKGQTKGSEPIVKKSPPSTTRTPHTSINMKIMETSEIHFSPRKHGIGIQRHDPSAPTVVGAYDVHPTATVKPGFLQIPTTYASCDSHPLETELTSFSNDKNISSSSSSNMWAQTLAYDTEVDQGRLESRGNLVTTSSTMTPTIVTKPDDNNAAPTASTTPNSARTTTPILSSTTQEENFALRVAKKIQRQLNELSSYQSIFDFMIDREPYVVAQAVRADEESNTYNHSRSSNNNWYSSKETIIPAGKWLICAFLCFMIVGIVTIAASITIILENVDENSDRHGGGTNNHKNNGIILAPTDPPTIVPVGDRFSELFQIIRPYILSIDDGTAISTIDQLSKYQYNALDWLAHQDGANVTVNDHPWDRASDYQKFEAYEHTIISPTMFVERFAVAVMFLSTDGLNWRDTLGFLQSSSICEWHDGLNKTGVLCMDDDTTGAQYVTDLILPDNLIIGTIPTELALLQRLKLINLDYNSLYGSIPSELYELSDLEVLWVRENILSGKLSPGFAMLSNLHSLDLAQNDLHGTIPREWGYFRSLSSLYLRFNDLSGTIPTQVGYLTGLRNIDIEHCNLKGTIPSQLGRLSNLKFLSLESNHLTGTIPTQLALLQDLDELYLDTNPLSGRVPMELSTLSTLDRVTLHGTNVEGDLDTIFCDGRFAVDEDTKLTETIPFTYFMADCLDSGSPEIKCSCCTHCCNMQGNNCQEMSNNKK